MWDWLLDVLRIFFFFIDSIVYPLISLAYELLMDIANTTIFTDDIIDLFASKVYALLGIFMLFKVSFSILTYIVNPDDFTDKSKGFTKIISNTVITLLLLVSTPWIFSQAMDLQRIILKDNIIGKVFTVESIPSISTDDAGNVMAFDTLSAFYHIDRDLPGYDDCLNIEKGELAEIKTSTCASYLGGQENFDKFYDVFTISYYTRNVDFYFNYDLLNLRNPNGKYVMSYLPIISTVAGGFVCWILIIFCFDIAVRSVKFGFLRMIAPVPIISRIDPKKGHDVFNKWLKACTGTYLDLFIRLLAIYFGVFVISLVGDMHFVDAATGLPADVNLFVKVFIIMGALLFAKQLPQLIADLTGAKLDGKFTMNPLKKLGEVPLIGGGLAAGATMAGGAALALGRGLANSVGGTTKLAAGKVLKNDKLINSGNRTLGNTGAAMSKRMHNTLNEADGRFRSSGLLGGEYKGETAHQVYAKEREENRKKARQARYDTVQHTALYDLGHDSLGKQKDLNYNSTEADYVNAGYQNSEYIRSLMAIESSKYNLDKARENLRTAQYNLDHADPSDAQAVAAATRAVSEAEVSFEKAQKAVSSTEENHNKLVVPKYREDAELERARKVAKGVRPGSMPAPINASTSATTSTSSTTSSGTATASSTTVNTSATQSTTTAGTTTFTQSAPQSTVMTSVPTADLIEDMYVNGPTVEEHQQSYSDAAEAFYSNTGSNYVAGVEAKVKHDSDARIKSYTENITHTQEQIAANIKQIEASRRIITENSPVNFSSEEDIALANQVREEELERVKKLIEENRRLQTSIENDYVEIERNKNYSNDEFSTLSESELVRAASEQIDKEAVESRTKYEEQLRKEVYAAADKSYYDEMEKAKKEYHQWKESISEHKEWGTTVSEQRKIAEAEMKKAIEKINELQKKREALRKKNN